MCPLCEFDMSACDANYTSKTTFVVDSKSLIDN